MKTLILSAALLAAGPANTGQLPRPIDTSKEIAYTKDTHPTFAVGTATAQRGQRAYGVLKVPAGSDAAYDIPVAVVHGAKPGPVLAVVSGAHGSEYASILAVQKLIET